MECASVFVQAHDEQEAENAKKFMDEQDDEDDDGNPVQKIEYEKRELNVEEANIEFDTMNPVIDIPHPVADHIDNDFDLPYQPPDPNAEWAGRADTESQWPYLCRTTSKWEIKTLRTKT